MKRYAIMMLIISCSNLDPQLDSNEVQDHNVTAVDTEATMSSAAAHTVTAKGNAQDAISPAMKTAVAANHSEMDATEFYHFHTDHDIALPEDTLWVQPEEYAGIDYLTSVRKISACPQSPVQTWLVAVKNKDDLLVMAECVDSNGSKVKL